MPMVKVKTFILSVAVLVALVTLSFQGHARDRKKKEVAERYPYADVIMAPLSLSIACHIGPGSLAVTATRKMDEEYEEDHGAV